MGCHAAGAVAVAEPALADVVLVGHPNVGKSVLFQRLTGRYVTVSNYPGTTVDVFRGVGRDLGGAPVVDTPGIGGFPAVSDDERVVSELLLDGAPHSLVQVGDAKSIRRTLLLTTQLAELGHPLTLVLNMADEAERSGVEIDRERLAELLGVEVLSTV
ncbi:MAG: FeoB small GTPase domain-containing protein, partial [Actinomycetota bacterium]